MNLETSIGELVAKAVSTLYGLKIDANEIQLQKTKREFEGELTVVIFPFVKAARKSPEQVGQEIGDYLLNNNDLISAFNVIKGFLNLSINQRYWLETLNDIHANAQFGKTPVTDDSKLMMIEYSSPNTNKPLHLGHIRNNLLGFSIAEIQKANGWKVVKTNIVNDRGIHICKSMLAWKKWGNGETPESSGLKGDHLVGKYYVLYNTKTKEQLANYKRHWIDSVIPHNLGLLKEYPQSEIKSLLSFTWTFIQRKWFLDDYKFENDFLFGLKKIESEISSQKFLSKYSDKKKLVKYLVNRIRQQLRKSHIAQAQKMLLKWENNDPEVRKLWETMNGWVYAGFDVTYKKLGVDFDKIYYESETYLEGKSEVERGEVMNAFYRREDGSVWADLTGDGLDEKLLLRADGTSVYMTQDIGTAKLRYNDYPISKMVYVVGNEQNYHFQVLSLLLDKLGFEWGKSLVHFSYGMVELPEGKMKSREGTVVDADDLMEEMVETARETSQELGKLDNCTPEEIENNVNMVGLGSLKYFILKVDPRKSMTFNPKESIDFNGNTGPFIQYTHARIKSVLRKAEEQKIDYKSLVKTDLAISEKESYLVQLITEFPVVVQQAGTDFSPALIANYIYELVKEFNQFYHDFTILKEENAGLKHFRLVLSETTASVIKTGMSLLGIDVPERM